MLQLKFATKANHKTANNTVIDRPDLTFSGKTTRFKMSANFFKSSGITGNKSIVWPEVLIDGKVVICTVEGNEGLALKKTERGDKGQTFTAATLVELMQSADLLPAINDTVKGRFDFVPLGQEVEGTLEAYYLVVSDKVVEKESDEEVEEVEATEGELELGEEVGNTTTETADASNDFSEEI